MPGFSRRHLLWLPALLRAQDSDATFSTTVKVVNLLATVRTRKGDIVRDLTADDFALLENGRPQAIRYFSRESDLPLTIGLLIDTSMSQQKVLAAERGAAMRFLDRVLREDKDRVFLTQFDLVVFQRQPLTNSRRKLEDALSFVDTPSRADLSRQVGGGTLLYDAVVASCRQTMERQSNRKAIIVLSDGDDTGSDTSLADAIEAAHRADTIVYTIYFTDAGFGGRDGRGVLQRLARETGGGYFEVTKRRSIEQIFDSIQEELRSQYSLGFVSGVPARVSEIRRLKLTTRNPQLLVQTRESYWARR
jgi:VWFA-related protein